MVDSQVMSLIAGSKTIAVIGASPKPYRDSYQVMAYLIECGYRVIAVNPAAVGSTILGCEVVARLQDIECSVDGVNVFRRSEAVAGVYKQLLQMKSAPTWLWLQQGVIDQQVSALADQAGITVVMDCCLMIEHRNII